MSKNFDDIMNAVFALPLEDRARLLDRLLTNLLDGDGAELGDS